MIDFVMLMGGRRWVIGNGSRKGCAEMAVAKQAAARAMKCMVNTV